MRHSTRQFSALASIYAKEKPEYLDQALESLHKQTLQADEVVIVHDGPLTEELYSCLEKWKQCLPIKEVKLKKNVGQALVRNPGLKKCIHDIVAIFDTDDINDPKRFEMQIKHLEKNPKISVLGTWSKGFGEDIDDILTDSRKPTSHKEIKDYAVNVAIPVVGASAMFARRHEVLSLGGYPNLYGQEDYGLFLEMIKQGYLFENIPEFLYFYRHWPYYFYFNRKLRVSFNKRWGVNFCLTEILIRKKRRELGNVEGYRKFFIFLIKQIFLLSPISFAYSFSKKNPKKYTSLLKGVLFFPLKILFGISPSFESPFNNLFFSLVSNSYLGLVTARYPFLKKALVRTLHFFALLVGCESKIRERYVATKPISITDKDTLKDHRDKYRGRRCFILGNGPSLNKLDLGKLNDEITFGTNGIFLITEKTGLKPTFYVATDSRAVECYLNLILKYQCHMKFISSLQKNFFQYKSDNITFFPLSAEFEYYKKISFSLDCSKVVYSCATVLYPTLQLAFYMGFSPIYLIGVDFHYKNLINNDTNHFTPDYHRGYKKPLCFPDLQAAASAFKLAKEIADKTGKSILNATPGSKLEVFDRVNYNSLF